MEDYVKTNRVIFGYINPTSLKSDQPVFTKRIFKEDLLKKHHKLKE